MVRLYEYHQVFLISNLEVSLQVMILKDSPLAIIVIQAKILRLLLVMVRYQLIPVKDHRMVKHHPYNSDSLTKYNSAERKQRLDASAKKNILEEHPRLDSTRVDPDEVIEQLVNTITQNAQDYADEHNDSQEYGLKLFVAKDGTTTLMSSKQGKGLAGQGLQHQGVRTHRDRDRERDASKPSSASSSTSSKRRSIPNVPTNQPPPPSLTTQSSSTSSSSSKSRPSSSHTADDMMMPPPSRPPPISSSSTSSSASSSSSETTCLANSTIVKL